MTADELPDIDVGPVVEYIPGIGIAHHHDGETTLSLTPEGMSDERAEAIAGFLDAFVRMGWAVGKAVEGFAEHLTAVNRALAADFAELLDEDDEDETP